MDTTYMQEQFSSIHLVVLSWTDYVVWYNAADR